MAFGPKTEHILKLKKNPNTSYFRVELREGGNVIKSTEEGIITCDYQHFNTREIVISRKPVGKKCIAELIIREYL